MSANVSAIFYVQIDVENLHDNFGQTLDPEIILPHLVWTNVCEHLRLQRVLILLLRNQNLDVFLQKLSLPQEKATRFCSKSML